MCSNRTRISFLTGFAIAILMLVQVACIASPAYPGYTGLIMTPTADIVPANDLNFGAAFVGSNNNDRSYFSGNFGIAQGFELGGALVDPQFGDSHAIINAKFRLLTENASKPALAMGISDLADELDASPYIVLSKAFSWDAESIAAPRFHVGLGGGSLSGLFGGLSASLGKTTQVMAEYDTNDLNFGAQFAVSNELRLRADLLSGENLGFGISFNKGF